LASTVKGLAGFAKGNILKLSNFCRKCGQVLCVCLSLGASPAFEDFEEPDYTTSQPAIEQVVETGGAAMAPSGWLVPAPRRRLAIRRRPFFRQPRRLYPLYAMNSAPFEGEGLPPMGYRAAG
jgi:hypothetical protein